MKKAEQLREHLTKRVRFFADNPDRLVMFVENARVIPRYAPNLNFVYNYPVTIGVESYSGNPDIVTVAIIEFLQTHQRDLMQNTDLVKDMIEMNAEFLDHQNYDLSYKVTLRESVAVTVNSDIEDDGRYDIEHVTEPIDYDQLPVRFAGIRDELAGLDWSPEAVAAFNIANQG